MDERPALLPPPGWFERHIKTASVIWWIASGAALALLVSTHHTALHEFREFLADNLLSLVLILIVAPFVVFLYITYLRLAQRRLELSSLDMQEKQLSLDVMHKEMGLRESLTEIAGRTASQISALVGTDLKNDTSWAASALREAAILGGALSIFGQRIHHFRFEKEALASRFFEYLLQRIRHLADEDAKRKIIVVLDSGTTVLPLFELFANAAVREFQLESGVWVGKTQLVTNNIPGIAELIKHGRVNNKDRFSEIPIDSMVLPGRPLAVYSAIVGKGTDEALLSLRNAGHYIIGLTTGNFVRVWGKNIVPLARGQGHKEFKTALTEIANEVYVLAALGKLILASSVDDFNRDLRFSPTAVSKDRHPYEEVGCTAPNKIKLVTTCRESTNSIMWQFSERFRDVLFKVPPNTVAHAVSDIGDISFSGGISEIPHFAFRFDPMQAGGIPPTKYEQELVELPHEYLRAPDIKRKYFSIT